MYLVMSELSPGVSLAFIFHASNRSGIPTLQRRVYLKCQEKGISQGTVAILLWNGSGESRWCTLGTHPHEFLWRDRNRRVFNSLPPRTRPRDVAPM